MSAISKAAKEAAALLAKIDTPEKAAALAGEAKAAYLKALEVIHGPVEQRAKDMGFGGKQTFYHGTPDANFNAFDPSKANQSNTLGPGRDLGSFFTSNPEIASEYATETGAVIPAKISRKGTSAMELEGGEFGFDEAENARLMLEGKKNVTIKGDGGVPANYDKNLIGDTVIVKDPSSVRSPYAAFDPRFKDSPIIMAGAVAAPSAQEQLSPMTAAKTVGDMYNTFIAEPVSKVGEGIGRAVTEATTLPGMTPEVAKQYQDTGTSIIKTGVELLSPFAEGGQVSAPTWDDTLPIEAQATTQQASAVEGATPTWDSTIDVQEKYGGVGSQIQAGIEGLAEGIAGPLAPAMQKSLGMNVDDIRGRAEANPITHGIGQGVGLLGGFLTGTGEAALMTKAGQKAVQMGAAGAKAAEAANLAKSAVDIAKMGGAPSVAAQAAAEAAAASKALSYANRVGSSAVQQAAEMAVLQSGDEVSKMILEDPNASAQSAIANIGLATALGGAGGAFMTGAVSPLWDATAGPLLEKSLVGLKNHLNGEGAILPETVEKAIATLGVDGAPLALAPEMRAGVSANQGARETFGILKEVQNPRILEGINQLHKDASESVARHMRVLPEDIAVYSENEAGHGLLEAFKREYDVKYQPQAAAMQKRNLEAAGISIPDAARLDKYGTMLERGMKEFGTDSPYYKLYSDYGNRLLAKDTIGGIDMLKTEVRGLLDAAKRGGDSNQIRALNDIRSMMNDFQEAQIMNAARLTERSGIEGAASSGMDLIAERAATNKSYAQFADMSDELMSNLSIGGFKGAGNLQSKLTDGLTAEQVLKKFTIKGNADFITFLSQHFPDTLAAVKQHELAKLLRPAVLNAKGEMPLNINKLHDIIKKGMAGDKEYIEAILPAGTIEHVEAAKTLMDAIPNHKSSGTAGWMSKVFKDMPRNAVAAVAMFAGHNPIVGLIMGEAAQKLSRNAPDALRLGYLKFLGSNTPVKAQGFKSMVEFFHAVQKGEQQMVRATANVFKRDAQVLTSTQMPNAASRDKLDETIDKMTKDPSRLVAAQSGQVGHYLPQHQTSLSMATTGAVQYLQALKPHPQKMGPLDKPIAPSPTQIARYNRALDIAQQPLTVLQRIKDGTIQTTDVQDLSHLYPDLYRTMSQKLSLEMVKAQADGETIPYKTRIGLSLFLAQPLDTSMQPASIMAAQPKPPPGPQQGGAPKSTKSLSKSPATYRTPSQASEANKVSGG